MYYIENETDEKIDLKNVRAVLKKLVSYYGEKRDFSVTFVTDEEIRNLNREYRDLDMPTDILTFRLDDTPSFPISFDEEDPLSRFYILNSISLLKFQLSHGNGPEHAD